MAITTQRIKDLNTVSEVPSGSKLLLTPDNGSYARATVPNIVNSAMDTGDFKYDSTSNKVQLKNKEFVGTTDEWDELTAAQKAQYILVNLTDDDGVSTNTFYGTTDEWAALSDAQKEKYDLVAFSNDYLGADVNAYSIPYDENMSVGDMLDYLAEHGGGTSSALINISTDLEDLIGETVEATYTASGQTMTSAAIISSAGTAQIAIYNFTGTVTLTCDTYTTTVTIVEGTNTYSAEFADYYEFSISTDESDLIGKTVTATYDTNKTETATISAQGTATITIKNYIGTVTFEAVGTSDTATAEMTIVAGVYNYLVSLSFIKIYGAVWDGSSSPAWTRTDAAYGITEPVSAVNNGNGSSPFDNILPWSGMEIVTDDTAGKLVSIPKYYFKWAADGTNGMKLQISSKEFDGSHVSPAHADRGDGSGERDVVYVGRYKCASDYKSKAGVTPVVNITRASARSSIHNLGTKYWQYDFAMYWTIMMLYLVEYANWNSQATIGYGCAPDGSTSAVRNMGYTDGMTYHTGTTAANKTTYGGTQYRHIEGLWDNCFDWCDGIYFAGTNNVDVYCIKNPSSFSDTTGGTKVATRPNSGGYISAWTMPSTSGFEYALYPSAVSGSDSTYVCDYCAYYSSGVVLCVGGGYGQSQVRGAFCLDGNSAASYSSAGVGCRLQKLP